MSSEDQTSRVASGCLRPRQEGIALLEIAMGLTILSIGLLSVFVTLHASHSALASTDAEEESAMVLENIRELIRDNDFSDAYNDFDDRIIKIDTLPGPDGKPAQVYVRCFVDEFRVQAVFPGITDLDGYPNSKRADCSDSYKLLPVMLTLKYLEGNEVRYRNHFFVLGPETT